MGKWVDSFEKDKQMKKNNFDDVKLLKLKVITDASGTPRAEDAKIARIRFLTDVKDAESVWVHNVAKLSRTGKRFTEEVYCMRQEGAECEFCHNESSKAPVKKKIMFWVYVYDILHLNNNTDQTWQSIMYMEKKYFVEPIHDTRLLTFGPGFNNYLETKVMSWKSRFGNITDRNYEWVREGYGMKDTSYDLVPDANGPSAIIPEVETALKNVKPLSIIVDALKPTNKDKTSDSKAEVSAPKNSDEVLKDIF